MILSSECERCLTGRPADVKLQPDVGPSVWQFRPKTKQVQLDMGPSVWHFRPKQVQPVGSPSVWQFRPKPNKFNHCLVPVYGSPVLNQTGSTIKPTINQPSNRSWFQCMVALS